MEQELQRIINEINLHSEWPTNAKIRYAYIELGKLVSKDTLFFYTIQKNFEGQDKETLQYSYDKLNEIMNTENRFDYKVICRNSAEMLQHIFKNCGIESEIHYNLETTPYITDEGEVIITHYFIVVTGDENKKYFLTLNADLPNIQLGRSTLHFGNNIPYKNRDDTQIYNGEEIKATIMSKEELRELDKLIGYIDSDKSVSHMKTYTDVLFDILKSEYGIGGIDNYFNYLASKTKFYKTIIGSLNRNINIDTYLESLEYQKDQNEEYLYLDFDYLKIDDTVWSSLQEYIIKSSFEMIYSQYIKDEKGLFNISYPQICSILNNLREKIKALFDGTANNNLCKDANEYIQLINNEAIKSIKSIIIKDLIANNGKPKDWSILRRNPFIMMNQIIYLLSSIYTFRSLKDYLKAEEEIITGYKKYNEDLATNISNFEILNSIYIEKKPCREPIHNFEEHANHYAKIKELLNQKDFLKKSIGSFITQIHNAASIFVNEEELTYEVLPTSYIIKKIKNSLTKVFDIGYKDPFSNLGLSEQAAIIKEVLHIILAELEQDKNLLRYLSEEDKNKVKDKKKSLIDYRVLMSVAFNKKTKKPYYLINISSINTNNFANNGEGVLLYDFENNILITNKTLTEICDEYYIIKYNDLNIEQIEEDDLSTGMGKK